MMGSPQARAILSRRRRRALIDDDLDLHLLALADQGYLGPRADLGLSHQQGECRRRVDFVVVPDGNDVADLDTSLLSRRSRGDFTDNRTLQGLCAKLFGQLRRQLGQLASQPATS